MQEDDKVVDSTTKMLAEFAKLIQEGKKAKEEDEAKKKQTFFEKYNIENTELNPFSFISELAKLKQEIETSEKEIVEQSEVVSEEVIPEPIVEIKKQSASELLAELASLIQQGKSVNKEIFEENKEHLEPFVAEMVQEIVELKKEEEKEENEPVDLISRTVNSITKVAEQSRVNEVTNLFSTTEPNQTAPNFKAIQNKLKSLEQWISKISTAGAGSGSYWLNDLGDTDKVSLQNATDGQVLTFSAAVSKWIAQDNAGNGGGDAVDSIARVIANNANANTVIIQGVDNTQNARVGSVETSIINQNNSITNLQNVNNTQNNNITTVTNLAQGAFDKANTSIGGVNTDQYVRDTANDANSMAIGAYSTANSTQANTVIIQGVNLTQNTNITSVNQYAAAAYAQANVTVSVDATQNTRIDGLEGVNAIQNTTITAINNYATSAYAAGNTNATNITSVNQYAQSAYAQANVTIGVDATQNTAISIIQGVDLTQNTNITTANNAAWAAYAAGNTNATNITAVNQYAQSAYTQANVTVGVDATQNTRLQSIETVDINQNTAITIIQGVDLGQNATITAVNQFAKSAYDTANTKFSSSGGTITGPVSIAGNNDLTVTGNLYVTGTQYVSNTQAFNTQDPLIILGIGNYTSDVVDIGFASHYNNGSNAHTGLIRDYGTKEYYFFQGYTPELDTNNNVDINHASFQTANTNATYFKGNLIATTAVIGGKDSQAVNDSQNTNITAVNQYATSAYNQANVTVGVDTTQNTWISSNASAILVLQGVDATQNTWISANQAYSQAAFAQANLTASGLLTANANISYILAVDLAQNTNITTANNAAWAAFAAGNTNATNITSVNQYAASAYAQANVTIGIDTTQNTWISSNAAAISVIQGVDATQNTWISSNASAILVLQGVNTTQNTWIGSNAAAILVLQGVNTTQNTWISSNAAAISIIQGVDTTQNTWISSNASAILVLQGVNTTQNTWISSNASAILVLQGVNTTQNTWISSNQAYSQAAFSTANNAVANLGPVITVNSAGYLYVANTIKNTTYTTGALVIAGGIGATGNLVANGSGQFQGYFDENSTVISAAIGVAGSGTPTPRFGFFNGTTAQNWQIDNNLGTFRWFTPGVSRMELNPYGILSVFSSNTSTSTGTGALIVSGGAGIAGNIYTTGIITANYQGGVVSTQNAAVQILGANTKGGTGYLDFMSATNTYPSANTKWFRISPTSNLQIINSGYTTTLFDLGDTGVVTLANTLSLKAGTLVNPPLDIPTGTLLTIQNAGTLEYDGAAAYFTPDTTIGRGFIPATSTSRLTAAGTAVTATIANFFGTTSNIPLVANAFYEIDIYAIGLKGSTAGAVTWTFTNTVLPTLMLVDYEQSPLAGQAAPPGSVTALTNINFRGTTTTTLAAYTFTTGTLAASVNHYFRFKIFLNNSTGTSLKIQLTAGNVNSAVTPQAGSVYFVRRLPGANTGSFAA